MNLVAVLSLGFFLGMRHATDADHVVAVSAIVSRERTLRAVAPMGVLWGIGHTLTILLVGGAIVLFGIVIPPSVGLGMELSVALMLLSLGVLNVRRGGHGLALAHGAGSAHVHPHAGAQPASAPAAVRPLLVGIVHGLAGSAAVALLVLGTIAGPIAALGYLLVFGVGTIAGMLLITLALALPISAAAQRFTRLHRSFATLTGCASIAFGAVLVYQIGFVHGLFTGSPHWTPQ